MGTRSPTSPTEWARRTRRFTSESQGRGAQTALDRRTLRERAERLLTTARATTDLADRTGLVIEAALLHRLATVGEEQAVAVGAWRTQSAKESPSFAPSRFKPRLN